MTLKIPTKYSLMNQLPHFSNQLNQEIFSIQIFTKILQKSVKPICKQKQKMYQIYKKKTTFKNKTKNIFLKLNFY